MSHYKFEDYVTNENNNLIFSELFKNKDFEFEQEFKRQLMMSDQIQHGLTLFKLNKFQDFTDNENIQEFLKSSKQIGLILLEERDSYVYIEPKFQLSKGKWYIHGRDIKILIFKGYGNFVVNLTSDFKHNYLHGNLSVLKNQTVVTKNLVNKCFSMKQALYKSREIFKSTSYSDQSMHFVDHK